MRKLHCLSKKVNLSIFKYDRIKPCILILFGLIVCISIGTPVKSQELNVDIYHKIEQYVLKSQDESHIPGLSLVIIKGGQVVFKKSYGFSDAQNRQTVNDSTFFEIGSNSKAITALSIFYLERKNLINLNDPVSKYIPWFYMTIKNKKGLQTPSIRIRDLLYHTSGIPFYSIALIRKGKSEEDLELTIRGLVGKQLDFWPGSQYSYASVNYDILGLVVQAVSQMTYEKFVKSNILEPMGLQNTFLSADDVKTGLAKGYKFGYFKVMPYDAPTYRANTPAGYIISNNNDITKWLKLQVNGSNDTFYNALLDKSKLCDFSVKPQSDGSWYAGGWFVYPGYDTVFEHGGNNPNYSSYFLCRKKDRDGVGILTNLSSGYPKKMAHDILDMMTGKNPDNIMSDPNHTLDVFLSVLIVLLLVFNLSNIYFLGLFLNELLCKRRKLINKITRQDILETSLSLIFLLGLNYCLFLVPKSFYNNLTWEFIKVWAPYSFAPSIKLLSFSFIFYYFYYACSSLFPKDDDKSVYSITIFSLVSGLGNAFVIFTINKAISNKASPDNGIVLYFVFGLYVYLYTQRLLRRRLIVITNNLIHTLKIKLVDKVLKTPFYKVNNVKNEEILLVINSDTHEISNFPAILVTLISGTVTILCCLGYLTTVNAWGLLIAITTLIIAICIFYANNKSTEAVWEKLRNDQTLTRKFIYDLIKGLKELKLNSKRKFEFHNDLVNNSSEFAMRRIDASFRFVNVYLTGELLFGAVIGVVVFLFPVFMPTIDFEDMRTFVFVFLYMTGPVNSVLNSMQQLTKIKISWKRIQKLDMELGLIFQEEKLTSPFHEVSSPIKLTLKNVQYSYREGNAAPKFTVGPFNLLFNSGEIIFVTGGNGSGKSTLAKLLTGLYIPDSGEIKINETAVSNEVLNEQYTAIFNDYHLFEKLYGIDFGNKADVISNILKMFQLSKKTEITKGVFSTLALSTGQLKRIALLVSVLEDKPILLFDEWASDQDPEFRNIFYLDFLLEQKRKNKCVIVISHDDRYFHIADRVIKLEMGQILSDSAIGRQ